MDGFDEREGWMEPDPGPQAETAKAKTERLLFVNPTTLHGLEVPVRKWIVPEWLPVGHVTLNYGDGGTGKTLLSQELMTSCATGRPWCGLAVERCKSLGLFAEDDESELHRRQSSICDAYGVSFADLSDMRWASGIGRDNLLVTFGADGRAVLTPRFAELKAAALDFGARLVVIDTAADTFGGCENDRNQVRQFVGRALNDLAQAIAGAVLLNAHPSRSGLSATGDLDGGSTGWSNSARSRWSLARVKDDGNGSGVDPNERTLTRRKANYSTIGDTIKLRWEAGVLVRADVPSTLKRRAVEDVFVQLLDRLSASGVRLSEKRNAGNYAPAYMARQPDRGEFGRRDFEQAMHILIAAGRIKVVTYRRAGHDAQALARAE